MSFYGLGESLTYVRGKISMNTPLSHKTWFRVGGCAEILFQPADQEDLTYFLRICPLHIPITVIGVTSNLLIRDQGIEGVVIKLGKAFSGIGFSGTRVIVEAGVLAPKIAHVSCRAGIAGLEFLAGIPGSVGGCICMNAGAFGTEISDVLLEVHALDRTGGFHILHNTDLNLGYRYCKIARDFIFIRALLQGNKDSPQAISKRIQSLTTRRRNTQPTNLPTGGSTFRNLAHKKAWEVIDFAGCRGLTRGGAKVSERHCNFLINTGHASAEDLEGLGEEIRLRVYRKIGLNLEWEIVRIGKGFSLI